MSANSTQGTVDLGGICTVSVVVPEGGNVLVEKQHGDGWVVANTLTSNGAFRMDFGRSLTRFTPSGGATWEAYP